jgi:hypothetical protein
VASVVVADLLEQWPSLQDLQRVKPAKLEKFLRDHHCSEIPERLTQIRQAIPATYDLALLDSAPYLVAAWVRQMAVLRESIRQLEKRIAERAAQQEDWLCVAKTRPDANSAACGSGRRAVTVMFKRVIRAAIHPLPNCRHPRLLPEPH